MSSDKPNPDTVYDPVDALVKQATVAVEHGRRDAIRPVLLELDRVSKEAERQRPRLLEELEHLKKKQQQWMARAVAAVEANDDELARRALSRKCQYERDTASIREDLEALDRARATLVYHRDQLNRALGESDASLFGSSSEEDEDREGDEEGAVEKRSVETDAEWSALSDPDISIRLVALKKAVKKGTITAIIGK